jgi:hypothetical protein
MTPLETYMSPWRIIRAAVTEDGAAAAVLTTGYTFNDKKASCVDLRNLFGQRVNGLILAFYGDTIGAATIAEDDTFGLDLIGYRNFIGDTSASDFNPAMRIVSIAAGAGIIGTREASPDGGTTKTGRWADTLTLSNNNWPGTVGAFDADGNNGMALLAIDLCGVQFLYPYVHSSSGAQAGEVPGLGIIGCCY